LAISNKPFLPPPSPPSGEYQWWRRRFNTHKGFKCMDFCWSQLILEKKYSNYFLSPSIKYYLPRDYIDSVNRKKLFVSIIFHMV
jgi:hypothetical protein